MNATGTTSVSAKLVGKKMLPLSPNALLRNMKEIYFDKFLQIRIQSFISYDYVVMLAETDCIEKTIKHIPKENGGEFVYMDNPRKINIMFVLLETVCLSKNVTLYTYEVKELLKKRKTTIKIIFYRWTERRLPIDYCETLQVIKLCASKKTICVGERHKEVFSLLYLLYKEVVTMNKQADIKYIFEHHARYCNGAPLDRCEMLYVLRFVLFWAGECSCVPIVLEKEYDRWCRIYLKMSHLALLHPNIMTVHPRHIMKNPGLLEKNFKKAHKSALLLRERPPVPMMDVYKRRAKERNKGKDNQVLGASKGGDDKVKQKEPPQQGTDQKPGKITEARTR